MTDKAKQKRILKLADFIEKLPRERFDFSVFRDGDLHQCGTVACALGWATEMPLFRRLGLVFGGNSIPMLRGGSRAVNDVAELFGVS